MQDEFKVSVMQVKTEVKVKVKVHLFIATVESVLLYNSNTWTSTKQMEKRLDGVYTRMLHMAMNVSWKQHMTNEELYGDLAKVTTKIAILRLQLAGHCVRHPEEIASQLVLWQPVRGNAGRGRKTTDFINVIKRDTNLDSTDDITNVMLDRNWWREFVNLARSGHRPREREHKIETSLSTDEFKKLQTSLKNARRV